MELRTIATSICVLLSACDEERSVDEAAGRSTARASAAHVDAALVGSRPVAPTVPWARVVAPVDPTVAERTTTHRRDMVIADVDTSTALIGEPRGALLYLAMDGITLRPCEDPNEIANSAKRCTGIVEATTEFPPWGDAAQRAALAQQVAAYYASFDVTVTTARPPDYMPYTLQAIGGTAALIGEDGICGKGHVDCGGQVRNMVGVVFPDQPNCTPPKTTAHESGHNFGLEHTIDDDDIMSYTLVYDGLYSFRDACMPLYHEDPEEQAYCGFTHQQLCPDGDGEQQNSRAELLAGLGPARTDDVAPTIVDLEPADGSVFTTEDDVLIGARVLEDGNFVGARWTWIGGLPDELPFGHDRCTNGMCTESFANATGDPEQPWDYLVLAGPPVGEYLFVFEVMDAHGNETVAEVRFEVVEPGVAATTDGGSESTGEPASAEDSSDDGELPEPEETGDVDALPPGFGAASADASGCSIARDRGGNGLFGSMAAVLLGLGVRRRFAARRACAPRPPARFSAPCGIVTCSAPVAPVRSAARSPRRSCVAVHASRSPRSHKRTPIGSWPSSAPSPRRSCS